MIPVPRVAVLHALSRDVWPQLLQCVTLPPPVRGYVTVEVGETPYGTMARLSNGPLSRDTPLSRCVRQAIERVVLPPYEGDPPPISIAFDLVFGMPLLTTARSSGLVFGL